MVIKEGYKQTEIGLIPNDWEVQSIQYLTENIIDYRGVTPRKLGMDWGKGSIVALSAGNVKKGYIDFDSECYLGSEELYTRWMRNGDSKKDDIAFTLEAPLGNIALIPDNKKYILSQRTILLQINKSRYYPIYVFQYLISSSFQNYISATATGSTAQGIKRKTFETLTIAIPKTLTEQTAIANALSDADGLITGLEKLIAKKRNIKQGAMQQLLQPKEGWEVKKLGELGKVYGGLSGKSKIDFHEGKFPYIPFMNIMSNSVINSTYLDYVNIKNGEFQNQALRGDLFFNGSSETPEEVGMCSALLEDIPNLYLNSFCFGYRLYKEHNADSLYLSYFFRSDEGRNLFYAMAQGATRYNLSKGNFLKLEIKLPKPEEQTRIASILSDMDAELSALEQKLEKYKKVKLGMMQELLTGKTRLV